MWLAAEEVRGWGDWGDEDYDADGRSFWKQKSAMLLKMEASARMEEEDHTLLLQTRQSLYPDQCEIRDNEIWCTVCGKKIKHNKKSNFDRHFEGGEHVKKLQHIRGRQSSPSQISLKHPHRVSPV